MSHSPPLIAGVRVVERPGASRWPAKLDVMESATGLVLVLFMWGHMFFVSSILVSENAMWTITKFFEGYFFFGVSYAWIVSIVVAFIITLIVAHAMLAMRKFPINYLQFLTIRRHVSMMRHEDTTLWLWQVVTGFALFFLASVHLYVMLTRPDRIGPFESADRVWSDHFWPLYILLLLAVELHGGIGLYRIAVKWGWFANGDANATRRHLKRLKWAITVFFLALGFATLAAYIKIGIAHQDRYGERYVPSHVQAPASNPAGDIRNVR